MTHIDTLPQSQIKTISIVYDENMTVEKFFLDIFGWSKQFYKKQGFPRSWSEQLVKGKYSYAIPIEAINHGKIRVADSGFLHKVKVIAENDLIAAIYKDEKIHSHPLNYSETDNTLSILLLNGRDDLLQINTTQYDRGLLYRLDYETSGLLLIAKNIETYQYIRHNFSSVMLQKMYRLKCHGKLQFDTGHWMHWILPAGKSKSKMTALSLPDKKRESTQAELSFKVIDYDEVQNISEVEVFLKTGMRHQIRVQFATMGHPIVGDELYSGMNADRLYLHAYQYTLVLDNNEMSFTAELPPNW